MKRDFKGIWIPAVVWLDESLTITEKCMLAEIESLDNDPERGCFASNEYLGKFLGISTGSAANMISKLKGMGLIVQLFFDGRNRGLRVPILHIDVNNLHTDMKADFISKGKQRSRTSEHITKSKNKEYNKVDNSSFSNEKGFPENERENIGDVAAEFEAFGEPAPLKAQKETPPKLRGTPPAAKEPTETYTFYEAWARFVEAKGIAVSKSKTGNSYVFAPKDGAAIKKWREWCAGLPNASGSLDDWHVFLQAAWEHGGKWYQSNFTPCILNSKRQELMSAFARYKAKNEPDMSMVGMSIDEILKNI